MKAKGIPANGYYRRVISLAGIWFRFCGLASFALLPLAAQGTSDWPMFGQNISNTANGATSPTGISAANAASLKTLWTFTTKGDVSARAAIVNGVAYFPDWGGMIWALDALSGKVVWSHSLTDYGLTRGTVSRTSPTVANGLVYIGTLNNIGASTGALLALNALTGKLVWKVLPDNSNIIPVITGSPVVSGGVVYVGMTSNAETDAVLGRVLFPCCTIRGSVVALNATTGAILWQTFTVPSGYSGGALMGSNPVVDVARGTVYVGTGDNYSVPTDPAYVACVAGGGSPAACLSPNDHADSIVALDMSTGAVRWATREMSWSQAGVTSGTDFWNVDCSIAKPGFSNCPSGAGPDFDFLSSPNEITYQTGPGATQTIIGAGQKSGIYYALDPDTGTELWRTQVGPGSVYGGIQWGSASDGTRIYVAISNFYGLPYAAGNAGSWAALDPATGNILWQTPDPSGAVDLGPVAVVNGVVFAPSMAGAPTAQNMFALNAATGQVIWSFASGASVVAGATIVGNNVYWGSGYSEPDLPGYSGNRIFYAFSTQ